MCHVSPAAIHFETLARGSLRFAQVEIDLVLFDADDIPFRRILPAERQTHKEKGYQQSSFLSFHTHKFFQRLPQIPRMAVTVVPKKSRITKKDSVGTYLVLIPVFRLSHCLSLRTSNAISPRHDIL